MLYANSSYTFLLFFSISRSIFTSSPIYREHPDNLYWNNTIPVGEIIKSQLRKEREREEESLENLISLESRFFQVFHHSPPLIRFRSFKTSPRRGSIVQRDTQELDRTDPQRTELSLRAVRPLPLEFPRGPLGDPFLPRDFLALESFGGRYISRNCKKQRGNKEARGKSFGKRDGGGHFARLLFC